MHPFRKLLLISLGRASSFDRTPSEQDWKLLYSMARSQSLQGVLYGGILRLDQGQRPPEPLLGRWKETAGRIAAIHSLHEDHVRELETLLERLHLQGCILKGTALARLYPDPSERICGDIDLWIKGNRRDILRAFREEGHPLRDVLYKEGKADIFPDTELEIHFHPSKMYNPFLNSRLQRALERWAPFSGEAPLTYPDMRFNAVFCMAHMFHHYLEGGLGLRQLMDYYYVLLNLDPSLRKPVMDTLRKLGMKRFTASVMAALRYNFGLEEEFFLCPPDSIHGKKLVEDMIAMGNFGVLDSRNYTYQGESALKRFLRKNRRVFSNLRYYPREVVWAPFSKLGQWVWRRLHGYMQ